jgi:hypothetical protein
VLCGNLGSTLSPWDGGGVLEDSPVPGLVVALVAAWQVHSWRPLLSTSLLLPASSSGAKVADAWAYKGFSIFLSEHKRILF